MPHLSEEDKAWVKRLIEKHRVAHVKTIIQIPLKRTTGSLYQFYCLVLDGLTCTRATCTWGGPPKFSAGMDVQLTWSEAKTIEELAAECHSNSKRYHRLIRVHEARPNKRFVRYSEIWF